MDPEWSPDGNLYNWSSTLVNDTNESLAIEKPTFGYASPVAPAYYPSYMRVWVTLVSGIIFVVGIGGNALVPLLFWKNKELRNSINVFLVNLALADLLVLLICLPTALVELHTIEHTWVLGSFLCQLVPFLEIAVTRASVVTLTVIGVERYVTIFCFEWRQSSNRTRIGLWRALWLCLGIWPVSLLAAGPFWSTATYKESQGLHNSSTCHISLHSPYAINWFMASFVIFYLVPLIFLATLYFRIANRLLDPTFWCGGRIDNSERRRELKQVAIMLVIVVAVFFLCLLPFQVLVIWIIYVHEERFSAVDYHVFYNSLFFCRIMTYINSTVNPIIYNTMSAEFRSALTKLFTNNQRPRRRLVRRRSTMTTSLSTSTSSSRTISLGRRASMAIARRFSNASSRRSSEKSLVSRRSSSSSRKTSNSSSRKGSNNCAVQKNCNSGDREIAYGGSVSQHHKFLQRKEEKELFIMLPCQTNGETPAESVAIKFSPEIDENFDSGFVEKSLFSSPPTSPNSLKKVSFEEQEDLYSSNQDEYAPVAPPRRKRSSQNRKEPASLNHGKIAKMPGCVGEIEDVSASVEIRKEDNRYDRSARNCKCNSKSITRCSFRKTKTIQVNCLRQEYESADRCCINCKENDGEATSDMPFMYLL